MTLESLTDPVLRRRGYLLSSPERPRIRVGKCERIQQTERQRELAISTIIKKQDYTDNRRPAPGEWQSQKPGRLGSSSGRNGQHLDTCIVRHSADWLSRGRGRSETRADMVAVSAVMKLEVSAGRSVWGGSVALRLDGRRRRYMRRQIRSKCGHKRKAVCGRYG